MPTSVSAEKYEELKIQLRAAQQERDIFENQYQAAQSLIEDLEQAKDKTAVKAIKKKHQGVDADADLDELISAVSDLKPGFMTKSFFIDAVVMDYHGRAIDIDFYDPDQKRMTQLAISSKLMSEDHGHSATWSGKMKPLGKAIAAVEAFPTSDGANRLNDDYPTDASDREFWEYHL